MAQDVGDGDFDGADIAASAAKRGCEGQFTGGLGIENLGRINSADGTRNEPAVGKTTDILVDGAIIGAGAATDALEDVPPDGVFENFRASVVENDDVEFLGATFIVAATGTCDELGVGGHFLSSSRASEQFQENSERFPIGDDLVEADDGDLQVGHGRDHTPIAFVGHHHKCARFGDEEVAARDAHIGLQEFGTQGLTRDAGEDLWVRRGVDLEFVAEDVGDLFFFEMHSGGEDV